MKRSGPLRRLTPLRATPLDRPPTKGPRPAGLRRTAIRRKKARNAESSDFWTAQREALFARSGGRCEVGGCNLTDTGMDAHHRRLRSQNGRHDLTNLLACCPAHHSWVHDDVAGAREAGWIVPSYASPGLTPARLHDGQLVLLTPEGGYRLVTEGHLPTQPANTQEDR